jgi:hypothetical protein
MTVQRGDKIIIDNRMYTLFSNPLEYYWSEDNPKPPMTWPTTSCYRGYIAKWEIIGNYLYLIDLIFRAPDGDAGLDYVFPDIQGKIKAEWYSGELRIPLGEPVICKDFPYYPPDAYIVTEIDWFIHVDKGRIISHIYNANS